MKTILITGASSGIGKATVELFAAKGWQVAATSRSLEGQLFSSLPTVKCYTLDVTNKKQVREVFTQVESDLGPIEAVVNNAGFALDGVFESFTDTQIMDQFETNVFGLMHITREAIAHMRPRGTGCIIQIASMGGRLTFPLYSAYHASKWAVEGFSESLAYELRQFGIQVKIIEPGAIKTAFYGKNRKFNKPETNLGYDEFFQKVSKRSIQTGKHGQPPEKVAKVIFKAACSKNNRLRYAVGSPAPLLLALRKILPERLFLTLIRLNYRIW